MIGVTEADLPQASGNALLPRAGLAANSVCRALGRLTRRKTRRASAELPRHDARSRRSAAIGRPKAPARVPGESSASPSTSAWTSSSSEYIPKLARTMPGTLRRSPSTSSRQVAGLLRVRHAEQAFDVGMRAETLVSNRDGVCVVEKCRDQPVRQALDVEADHAGAPLDCPSWAVHGHVLDAPTARRAPAP